MSLRDFANEVFDFINTESLTSAEEQMLDMALPSDYTRETFINLKEILETRESISDTVKKMKFLFLSQGANVYTVKDYKPKSNIFIGSPL